MLTLARKRQRSSASLAAVFQAQGDPQTDIHAPLPAPQLRPFVHAHLHDTLEAAQYAMRLGYLIAATYSLSRNQMVIRFTTGTAR